MDKMEKLQKTIGYTFKNKSLLKNALTHSSFLNECGDKSQKSNERLEFLGDAVLGLVIAQYLYDSNPGVPEGILTKARASTVCEDSLAEVAKKICLGDYLFMSRGEMKNGGTGRKSSLSDATEALIAAIYLDGGADRASEFILRYLSKTADDAVIAKNMSADYKTKLQELVQKSNGDFCYKTIGESGPDHDKHFEVELYINGESFSKGEGNSKKQAEQQAARLALEKLGK